MKKFGVLAIASLALTVVSSMAAAANEFVVFNIVNKTHYRVDFSPFQSGSVNNQGSCAEQGNVIACATNDDGMANTGGTFEVFTTPMPNPTMGPILSVTKPETNGSNFAIQNKQNAAHITASLSTPVWANNNQVVTVTLTETAN